MTNKIVDKLEIVSKRVVDRLKTEYTSRQELTECFWTPTDQLFISKIQQEPSTRLQKIYKLAKVKSTRKLKPELCSGILERLRTLYSLLNSNHNNKFLVSLDVGVKNMAWVRGDLRSGLIVDARVDSLESQERPLSKNCPSEYAKAVYEFIQSLPKDEVFLCEQQHVRYYYTSTN